MSYPTRVEGLVNMDSGTKHLTTSHTDICMCALTGVCISVCICKTIDIWFSKLILPFIENWRTNSLSKLFKIILHCYSSHLIVFSVNRFLSTNLNCSRTHSLMIIGVGSLNFWGDNHLEVAGSILTAGD